MSMLADVVEAVIGGDTHRDTHALEIIETARTSWRNPANGKVLPGDNRIWINVTKVLVYGEVMDHDFFEPIRAVPSSP